MASVADTSDWFEKIRLVGASSLFAVILYGTAVYAILMNSDLGAAAAPKKCGSQGTSQQYKGVVCQSKGKWGAQIYTKQRRIWLGTFDTAEAAAMAYDRASVKLRGIKDALTNFVPPKISEEELRFMDSYTSEEIVEMIRDHCLEDKLRLKNDCWDTLKGSKHELVIKYGSQISAPIPVQHMFQKVLTPSDVGSLNRIVIPKHQAERYFPKNCKDEKRGITMKFLDMGGNRWDFKYAYWQSSQSYVLSTGWIKFVKDKRLQAGDVVSFARDNVPRKDDRLPCFFITADRPPPKPRRSCSPVENKSPTSPPKSRTSCSPVENKSPTSPPKPRRSCSPVERKSPSSPPKSRRSCSPVENKSPSSRSRSPSETSTPESRRSCSPVENKSPISRSRSPPETSTRTSRLRLFGFDIPFWRKK